MWKHFFKEYFVFTKKERKGILIIVSITLFFILLPFFFPFFIQEKQNDYAEFKNEISKLSIERSDSSKYNSYGKNYNNELYDDYSLPGRKNYDNVKAEVFYFDPNNTSFNDWKRLGIKDRTIQTIQNYLSKGAKFYKPEDIGKIWGLSAKDVLRLVPYVSIKIIPKEYAGYEKKEYPKNDFSYSPKVVQPVEINLADTTAYITLPGIGSKLSQRIISFREKLGGFYSVEQVGETYFLPDSTFQKIKSKLIINGTGVKQININIASVDEMKAHPYIRYNLANAIFQFRQQHGNYSTVDDIKKIMLITPEVFQKLSPYLSVQ